MSDASVHDALRSPARLVVIEAPAGCGKTYQGAEYAKEVAAADELARPLILTHTHAARSVFAARTAASRRVDIRTIDSVIVQIAAAYHSGLGLSPDPVLWIRQREHGYQELAAKIARFLERHPMIAGALARRYPIVVCDEHQDSSGDQHAVVNALLAQGARVRVFADPMQKIFREDEIEDGCSPCDWDGLLASADRTEKLDEPHRWDQGCRELGRWILRAREQLSGDGAIDLRKGSGRPESVQVVIAENIAQAHDQYRVEESAREPIDRFVRMHQSLLILTRGNALARALRSFFNRTIPLWEGHRRDALETLVRTASQSDGDCEALARACVTFMADVGVGFTRLAFGDRLIREAAEGCRSRARGKAALLQDLARCVVNSPSHRGISALLTKLATFREEHDAFAKVKVDHQREFWEAVRLGRFDTAQEGLAQITHRRSYAPTAIPSHAISNIHKAKGLECRHTLLIPCSRQSFPNTPLARRLLYVAISRASHKLLIVASRDKPSPLLRL